MHALLGPVRCQGCGQLVTFAQPRTGLAGWFVPGMRRPVRHHCKGASRLIAPMILRPWTESGLPYVFEVMLDERPEAGA